MEFKPAKCPNCSGDLQLPDNMKKVKCMYCGTDIIVKEAIKLAVIQINPENILKLADVALESGNYEEVLLDATD
jgi:DNA-directed RNA polymerase subunit RPC12/RpoP